MPKQVGQYSSELVIQYSTGELVYTKLYGSANDINVQLEKSSVLFDETFIGLTTQRYIMTITNPYTPMEMTVITLYYRSVTLHNDSDVVVHYQWRAFSSEFEEDMQREM